MWQMYGSPKCGHKMIVMIIDRLQAEHAVHMHIIEANFGNKIQ